MACAPLPSTWQKCLTNHPLLESSSFVDGGRHCIAQNDGDFFVWKNEEKHLCFINLKRLQSYVQSGGKDAESLKDYQTLTCSQLPQFTVLQLKFSPTGQFVALLGKRQAMIMRLPSNRGHKGLYGDGRREVSCRSFHLAERLLSSSSHLDLLQFLWHPGSVSETHVLMLTSDNIIRLCCFSHPNKYVQTYAIAPGASSYYDSGKSGVYDTTRAISMAGTETVVDFDVLPGSALGAEPQTEDLSCHVFALMDSGDVYMLKSTLPSSATSSSSRPPVHGHLRMQPSAEDNYGSDSCSICCLNSHPPALVLASAEGRIFHCLIMCDDTEEDTEATHGTTHWTDRSSSDEPILYVFEGIALSLEDDFVEENHDSQDTDSETYPMRLALHRLGSANDRYLCTHGSGIHSVVLPWLRQMDAFCVADGDESKGVEIGEVNLQQECHVEHLVSSRPFKHSPSCPLASFCTVCHPFLGNTLVCITESGVCSTVDIRRAVSTVAAVTLAESTETGGRARAAKSHDSAFVQSVEQLLSERGAMPILRLSCAPHEMTSKMGADILKSATDTFRDHHFPVMRKVATLIAKHAKMLENRKKHQQRECAAISHDFQDLQAAQADIADQGQALLSAQDDLTKRLYAVFHALEFQVPVRSVAEDKMAESLRSLSSELKKIQQQLEAARRKADYHKSETPRKNVTELGGQHLESIRAVVKKDTEDIEQLVEQVKMLAVDTSS